MHKGVTHIQDSNGMSPDPGSADEVVLDPESMWCWIADSSPDYIMLLDRDAKIVYINRTLSDLTVQQVVGTPLFDYVPLANRRPLADCLARVFDKVQTGYFETEYPAADSTNRYYAARIGPVTRDGHVIAATMISRDITDRMEAKRLLQEERNFVSSVLDVAACLVLVLDPEGRIVRFNRSCEERSGHAFEEVRGKKVWEISLLPEDASVIKAVFQTLVAGDFPRTHEHRWVHRDGSQRLLAWHYNGVLGPDGEIRFVVGTGTDITESRQSQLALVAAHDRLEQRVDERTAQLTNANQKLKREITDRIQAENDLRQSETRYRHLYNHTPVMMHSIDQESRIISVNDFWLRTLGYDRHEVLGRRSTEFLTDESRRLANETILPKFFQTGFVTDVAYQMVKKTGQVIDVCLSAVTENGLENGPHSMAFLVDVTERNRAQTRAQKHQEELAHMARLQTVGELASGLAHEINQPLTAISNYAQICAAELRGEAPDNQLLIQTLDKVSSQCHRVSEIVRRLRNFITKDIPRQSKIDVNAVIHESVELLTPEARHGRVKIGLDLHAGPLTIEADGIQIEQVILNLAKNAFEAMRDTPVDRRELKVVSRPLKTAMISVVVTDTGMGLPDGLADSIFEPFFTTKPNGMGVGLSISRTIIEAHHGKIAAKNAPTGGATFTVLLPATP